MLALKIKVELIGFANTPREDADYVNYDYISINKAVADSKGNYSLSLSRNMKIFRQKGLYKVGVLYKNTARELFVYAP